MKSGRESLDIICTFRLLVVCLLHQSSRGSRRKWSIPQFPSRLHKCNAQRVAVSRRQTPTLIYGKATLGKIAVNCPLHCHLRHLCAGASSGASRRQSACTHSFCVPGGSIRTPPARKTCRLNDGEDVRAGRLRDLVVVEADPRLVAERSRRAATTPVCGGSARGVWGSYSGVFCKSPLYLTHVPSVPGPS
jgi:hypothetical protein